MPDPHFVFQRQLTRTLTSASHNDWHQDIAATTAGEVLSCWRADGTTRAGGGRRNKGCTHISESRWQNKNCFEGSEKGGLSKVADEFGWQSPRGGGDRASNSVGIDGPSALCYCFLPSLLNDKKSTSPTNEMGIRT